MLTSSIATLPLRLRLGIMLVERGSALTAAWVVCTPDERRGLALGGAIGAKPSPASSLSTSESSLTSSTSCVSASVCNNLSPQRTRSHGQTQAQHVEYHASDGEREATHGHVRAPKRNLFHGDTAFASALGDHTWGSGHRAPSGGHMKLWTRRRLLRPSRLLAVGLRTVVAGAPGQRVNGTINASAPRLQLTRLRFHQPDHR